MLLMICAAVAALLLFKVLELWRYAARCRRLLRSMPYVPGSFPFLGLAPYLTTGAPWDTFAGWSKQYGTSVVLDILGTKVIFTTEPKFIRRVLQTNQKNYSKNIAFSYKHFMPLLGRGLVTAEGERWRKNRILLSHAFRVELLHDIPQVAYNAARHAMLELAKAEEGRKTDPRSCIDLLEQYRVLTLEVISRAVLSMSPEESERVFPNLYLPIATECNKRVWTPWRQFYPGPAWRHRRLIGELNEFFSEFVRKRKALRDREKAVGAPRPRKEDILDRCMEKMEPQWHPTESVLQLRDDLKTFILAGHETSGSMLTWATYELFRHPETLAKVRVEHEAVFGAEKGGRGELPPFETLRSDLKWSLAVLRECLRLYSIVPLLPRSVDADDEVAAEEWGGGEPVTVPRGTIVMVGVDALHHRPDLWPDPYTFKAERFLDMSAVDEYSFIPFIAGPRNCLGQHLALLEASIVLSFVAYYWDLQLADPEERKAGLKRHPLVVPLSPLNGLRVLPTARRPLPLSLEE